MASMIGAQLYTVRDYTKTPADIARTFAKVRDIGYEAVQVSALGPIDAGELARIAQDTGVTICASHVDFEALRDDTERLAEEHRLWGCRYAFIGGMPAEYRDSGEAFHRFAEEASEVAGKMKAFGLVFGYHNHSFELRKFGDRVGLDILLEDSDPDLFMAEIDTYWIQHGGGDPAAWITKAAGRIPVLHLKDMAVGADGPMMAEIGEGNLNWPAILAAARDAGTEWYLVEQDTCQRDPFESLRISFDNLRAMGLE